MFLLRQHLLVTATMLCVSRQRQWQRRGAPPADLETCLGRFNAAVPSPASLLEPRGLSAVLEGNRINMKQLERRVEEERIWPSERDIGQPSTGPEEVLRHYRITRIKARLVEICGSRLYSRRTCIIFVLTLIAWAPLTVLLVFLLQHRQ